MTEIFVVIDCNAFEEKYGEMDFLVDYLCNLKYDDLEKLCEEGIAERLKQGEFNQRFDDGDYNGYRYYVRIFEFEEED